ncbi:MAG: hypothetical protein NTU63_03400, partial [Candidatus Pacearchaeota archaeon]|nr:hypothetical protein [Candidatus Pacearchaeota archaeon]
MAYKRYIKRDGKIYGPYIYHSRKVNGSVISEYLGKYHDDIADKNKSKNKFLMLSIAGFILLVFLLILFSKYNLVQITNSQETVNFFESIVNLKDSLLKSTITGLIVSESSENVEKIPEETPEIIPEENITTPETTSEENITIPEITQEENVTLPENITEETNETTPIESNITTPEITPEENITIPKPILETNITIPENVTVEPNITVETTPEGNATISTIQYPAVLGQPVKWKKEVIPESLGNITIKLPKEAENVVVNEIVEKNKERITPSITGGVISSQTKKGFLAGFFQNLIGRITGRAIDNSNQQEKSQSQEISVEVEADNSQAKYEIEYETPAPYAIEQPLAQGNGKEVKIIGPDSVHYENVLSFTDLDENLNVNNPPNVKIRWVEQETYIIPLSVQDTDNNGIYDYVEWITPRLSNQTFEIFVPSSYMNYNYEYQENGYKIYFKNNTNLDSPLRFERGGYYFVYDISEGEMLWKATPNQPDAWNTLGGGYSSNSLDTQIQVNGGSLVYPDAFSNTNITYDIQKNSIKENFILSYLPSIKNYLYLEYSGRVEFNASLKICANGICYSDNANNDFNTSGQIDFKDSMNKILFSLKAPIITDSWGNTTLGLYMVHGSNAAMQFWLRIPTSFIINSGLNQTYPIYIDPTIIIPAIDAQHLNSSRGFISDIYEQVKAQDDVWSETIPSNDYVRVTFKQNLTNENDITLYPRIVSGNPAIEVYEKDKSDKIAEFSSLNSNQYNKVYLTNLQESQDIFDLKVVDGSIEFDYIVDPTVEVSLKQSSTIITDSSNGGQINWSSPMNATTTDGKNASIASVPVGNKSVYLKATNYGFAIPLGSAILGINVTIRKSNSNVGRIRDLEVKLVKDGIIQATNKSSSASWGTNGQFTTISYGGPENLWATTWTPEDINAVNFGVVFSVYNINAASAGADTRIDSILISVNYSAPPTITVISPTNGTTYTSTTVEFNISMAENSSWCGFSLDNAANITMTRFNDTYFNFTNSSMTVGDHNVTFACNNTYGAMNSSSGRTYFTVNVDTTYPQFSTYWDNNGSQVTEGIGLFNVTVSSTNGTVILNFNGTNYTASNSSGDITIFNVTIDSVTTGKYPYNWSSYGNGTNHLYNISNSRSYTVNSSGEDTIKPNVNITYPTNNNTNWSINNLTVNYTVTDANLQACWYSNDTMLRNFSLGTAGS